MRPATRRAGVLSFHQRLPAQHEAIGNIYMWRILFLLDAIQTLGAFPTTMEYVDFLAADAHKWLLGPCGAGVLYVRRELQEKLNPPIYGWHNVKNPNFVAQDKIEFRNDATKYEAGTHNLLGIVGLIASLELVQEIGLENIVAELLRKPCAARAGVASERLHGFRMEMRNRKNASGIATFFQPGKDLTLVQKIDGRRRHRFTAE